MDLEPGAVSRCDPTVEAILKNSYLALLCEQVVTNLGVRRGDARGKRQREGPPLVPSA